MVDFMIDDGNDGGPRGARRLESGTYPCLVKSCEIRIADKGPSVGLPELSIRFRIFQGPMKGLEITWRAPTRKPTDEEAGRGIRNLAWITKNFIQAAFFPTYKTGDALNTDDFLGKRCNVTIEMQEGSKWPRVKNLTPYIEEGALGEFNESQYFGDPDIA